MVIFPWTREKVRRNVDLCSRKLPCRWRAGLANRPFISSREKQRTLKEPPILILLSREESRFLEILYYPSRQYRFVRYGVTHGGSWRRHCRALERISPFPGPALWKIGLESWALVSVNRLFGNIDLLFDLDRSKYWFAFDGIARNDFN